MTAFSFVNTERGTQFNQVSIHWLSLFQSKAVVIIITQLALRQSESGLTLAVVIFAAVSKQIIYHEVNNVN